VTVAAIRNAHAEARSRGAAEKKFHHGDTENTEKKRGK
jgi:hypothetical protein